MTVRGGRSGLNTHRLSVDPSIHPALEGGGGREARKVLDARIAIVQKEKARAHHFIQFHSILKHCNTCTALLDTEKALSELEHCTMAAQNKLITSVPVYLVPFVGVIFYFSPPLPYL